MSPIVTEPIPPGHLLQENLTCTYTDYMLLSVIGALAHNLGQLLASVTYTSTVMFYYLPVLVVSGVVMGIITGVVLKVVMPYINKIGAFPRSPH